MLVTQNRRLIVWTLDSCSQGTAVPLLGRCVVKEPEFIGKSTHIHKLTVTHSWSPWIIEWFCFAFSSNFRRLWLLALPISILQFCAWADYQMNIMLNIKEKTGHFSVSCKFKEWTFFFHIRIWTDCFFHELMANHVALRLNHAAWPIKGLSHGSHLRDRIGVHQEDGTWYLLRGWIVVLILRV